MRNIKEMDKRLDEREQEIEKLQQENKQLKEQLEYLRSNEYLNQVKWERNFNEELVKDLQQENKQLKEQLENKIDLYEDTISYQLGFDKGKEYMQQRIDNVNKYIDDLLEKGNDKTILAAIKFMLGDKE